jgi:glycosyltransferase involved in cell wall biosynthesis
MQGVQSPYNADRGIGRYLLEYARAVEQNHPGAVDGWIINPRLPLPLQLVDLMHRATVRWQDDEDLGRPDVWHVLSPFEASSRGDSMDNVWPQWARGPRTRLVVTMYDLIPLIYADRYLSDPETRRAYMARLQLLERADRILSISEATANDGIRLLGIPASKFEVVGTGVSEHFVAAPDVLAVEEALRSELPGLRPGYILYTGGIDFRKNIEGLITAYARLPEGLRREHQLVIVCRVQDSEREHLEQRALALGIEADFLLTGFVPDDHLLHIYQAAHLFMFPSLYEGFGLPVLEALSCGVPTMVGRNSSLTEIVRDPAAWFDASIVDDITRAMFRALSDEEFRTSLRRNAAEHDYRWNVVAERSLAAYERAVAASPRGRSKPRIALISPMPPAHSGVADYSLELLRELAPLASVDVYTSPDADRVALPDVRWFTYGEFDSAVRVGGPYDDNLVAMGNSEHHHKCLALLRRHGGAVIAHDVRYTGLFQSAESQATELVDARTSETVAALGAGKLPERFAHYGQLQASDYYRVNDLLIEPIVESAHTVYVHSRTAMTLARLNLSPGLRDRIRLLPYGNMLRSGSSEVVRDTIASFGIVDRIKRSDVVAAAFIELARRDTSLRFALVGECFDADLNSQLRGMVEAAGVGDRFTLTGRVDEAEYGGWLDRSMLAVQLRAHTNGESSGAVGNCLRAGVPTVVSQIGSMAELGDACIQVPVAMSAAELTDLLADLLGDPEALATARTRAELYGSLHTFAPVARALVKEVSARIA